MTFVDDTVRTRWRVWVVLRHNGEPDHPYDRPPRATVVELACAEDLSHDQAAEFVYGCNRQFLAAKARFWAVARQCDPYAPVWTPGMVVTDQEMALLTPAHEVRRA